VAELRRYYGETCVSADPMLDRALASLERLDEAARAMMRRLDELMGDSR
jgi:hypothetical protein